jgi:hypothetical protein
MAEDVVKLMKVVWMSFPLGIFITIAACLFVLWWQEISYFSPHGQAILINGNLMKLFLSSEYLFFLWVIVFSIILSPFKTHTEHPRITLHTIT